MKLSTWYAGGRSIEFLKIDVEGWEKEVLCGLDLKKHRPIIILIEATYQCSTIPSHTDWEHLLLNNDYQFVYFDGLNRFYVAAEQAELEEHFANPPNVHDRFKLADSEAHLEQVRELTAIVNQMRVLYRRRHSTRDRTATAGKGTACSWRSD
jgi:hypothetical protein